jgi:hypothetical protein
MHPKNCFIFFLLVLLLSCKKEATAPSITNKPLPQTWTPDYSTYLPCKKGNYWIYELFRFEQHGDTSSMNKFDSVYVVKDTLIRGNQYWKIHQHEFVRNWDYFTFTRDSLHYIIDEKGKILFSSEDFSTVFSEFYMFDYMPYADTVCRVTSKMNDKDFRCRTAAGIFVTSNMQHTIRFYPKYIKQGVNDPRYMNKRYAKNIGIVQETEPYYVSQSFGTERRLIRYKIN